MMEYQQHKFKPPVPFKSTAAALLFCALLGPVGLLYSTVVGGVVMLVLGFIVLGFKFIVPIVFVWLISCVWGVAATNRYNKKLLKLLFEKN